MTTPPESFLITGPTGPVHDVVVAGETDRVRGWGEALAAELRGRVSAGR